jgi:predicted Zn-dependent peptidase
MSLRKRVLNSGPVLLTERVPHSGSLALGLWLPLGSRHEAPSENGYAHFTEHMLFKGTATRSAYRLAAEIDGVGGDINGSTGKENTGYSVQVAGEHWERALDTLLDMYFNASFAGPELEKERQVLLEEIDLAGDDPEEQVSDLFSRALWGEHPLGNPVIGDREEVLSATRERLAAFYRRHYRAGGLVVSASGNLDEEALRESLERQVPREGGEGPGSDGCRPRSGEDAPPPQPPGARYLHQEREMEQVHLLMGAACWGYRDPERYPLLVLNTVLGGSISSRLFQRVRESEGMCYAISSGVTSFTDTGEFTVGFSTSMSRVTGVLEAVAEELRRVKREGITAEELDTARAKMQGNLVLAAESMDWRMARMAVQEMVYGGPLSYRVTRERINSVTAGQVLRAARLVLSAERFCVASVGPPEHHRAVGSASLDF